MIGVFARQRLGAPFLGVSLAVLLLLITGWLLRPRATLYATVFLTAIAEGVTIWWFPFTKNLSSRESIAYVADAATVSPLEMALLSGAAISMLRRYAATGRIVPRTTVETTMALFTAMLLWGLFRGITTGGDLRIAVIESRALFYIPLMYVIVQNECSSRRHLRTAMWFLLAGVAVQSVLTGLRFRQLDEARLLEIDTLTEHASVIAQNLLIVTFLGVILLRPPRARVAWALLVALVPTIYVIMVAQRRSGIAALLIGLAALAVTIAWKRRGTFLLVAPVVAVLAIGYTAAFWNSTSSAGFAAQAIKGAIDPGSVSAADRSSDLYRIMEGYNINATIRASPIRGLGFGRAFYRPIPLPDISAFELNAYLPHNAILWLWIKLGFIGFAAMTHLLAKSIVLGAQRIRREAIDLDLVTTVSATLLIMMFVVFSWVDVSWSARNNVFLGLAFSICAWHTRTGPGTDGDATTETIGTTESSGPADREMAGARS